MCSWNLALEMAQPMSQLSHPGQCWSNLRLAGGVSGLENEPRHFHDAARELNRELHPVARFVA